MMNAAAPVSLEQRLGVAVPEWRERLTLGREALRQQYQEHGHADRLLSDHAKLIDALLADIWNTFGFPERSAMLAVGGYGRGQLYPYSDVDFLILLEGEIDADFQEKLEHLVGKLWDIGLDAAHSVRTVAECQEEAAKDISVETSLLEARWLVGSRRLAQELIEKLKLQINPVHFYDAKLAEQQVRHNRHFDTTTKLEPNIKESPGGLRDLQTIIWIARACGFGGTWAQLARHGIITVAEGRQLKRLETVLENLRIRLHYLVGRREDRLLFDFQTQLAKQYGFADHGNRRASEQLMEIFYRAARGVGQLNEILLQNLRARIIPPSKFGTRPINAHFMARNNLLEALDDELFERHPEALLEPFHLLQQHTDLQGIAAHTLRAIWHARGHIDAAFRRDPQNRARFLQILREPRGVTHELRRMHRYGILGRYIPAFGRIIGQMQHDLFHVYTVDEHILKVVSNLRRFALPEFGHEYPLCSRLMEHFAKPELLYLAGLFHDIAKGRGGDHSELGSHDARRFCRQHDLPHEDCELVAWLVEKHLYMSFTAQKRDLSDPSVIRQFADAVGNEYYLTALYLLTVADVRGTSPKVWNAWKSKLLEDLFWATKRLLDGQTDAAPDSRLTEKRDEAARILRLYAINENAATDLWQELDTAYFMRHDAQEIAWHTRMIMHRVRSQTPIVRARLSPIGEGLEVMLYCPDQPYLFARICDFFERKQFDILDARVYTTRHGYALDSFQVMSSASEVHYRNLINLIEHELTTALRSTKGLDAAVQGRKSRHVKHFPLTPEIVIQPDERGQFHVLSIVAGDSPGLLSRISRTLAEHAINVHMAKISTLGERAEDTFLVTGEALNQAKSIVRLESDLMQQLQM